MRVRLFLENRRSEIRWVLRSMRRDRGTSALAVLSLALGIGANRAIFSLVNTVLMKFPPVRSPQERYLVAADHSGPRVAIVSESFARKYLAGGSPTGARGAAPTHRALRIHPSQALRYE